MRRAAVCVILLALSLLPGQVWSQGIGGFEEHVSITPSGFFPPQVIVKPGMKVSFHNETRNPQVVSSAMDTWSTGVIQPGSSATITYVPDYKGTFHTEFGTERVGQLVNIREDGTIEGTRLDYDAVIARP